MDIRIIVILTFSLEVAWSTPSQMEENVGKKAKNIVKSDKSNELSAGGNIESVAKASLGIKSGMAGGNGFGGEFKINRNIGFGFGGDAKVGGGVGIKGRLGLDLGGGTLSMGSNGSISSDIGNGGAMNGIFESNGRIGGESNLGKQNSLKGEISNGAVVSENLDSRNFGLGGVGISSNAGLEGHTKRNLPENEETQAAGSNNGANLNTIADTDVILTSLPGTLLKGALEIGKSNLNTLSNGAEIISDAFKNSLESNSEFNAETKLKIPSINNNIDLGAKGSDSGLNGAIDGSKGLFDVSVDLGGLGSFGGSNNNLGGAGISSDINIGRVGSFGGSANLGGSELSSNINLGRLGSFGANVDLGNLGSVKSNANVGGSSDINLGRLGSFGANVDFGKLGSIDNTNIGESAVGGGLNLNVGLPSFQSDIMNVPVHLGKLPLNVLNSGISEAQNNLKNGIKLSSQIGNQRSAGINLGLGLTTPFPLLGIRQFNPQLNARSLSNMEVEASAPVPGSIILGTGTGPISSSITDERNALQTGIKFAGDSAKLGIDAATLAALGLTSRFSRDNNLRFALPTLGLNLLAPGLKLNLENHSSQKVNANTNELGILGENLRTSFKLPISIKAGTTSSINENQASDPKLK